MRTCWSNCRLRLSSYQSCLVRNTLLRQSSTFKPLLWHRPNLGHWPSGLLGSWTLQKFALLENLRRRRSGLCEQTQFLKLNILLSTRQDYVGIDFTIAVETFGETRIELLKPEGDSIPVTSENRFGCFYWIWFPINANDQIFRIEYIHLVADYKLNRQIKAQCSAFRFRSGLWMIDVWNSLDVHLNI